MAREQYPDDSGSSFLRHMPCSACGSRDNNALFTDGHQHCFGCGAHTRGDGSVSEVPRQARAIGLIPGEVKGLTSRKITAETCAKFGYLVGQFKNKTVQAAPYYDADGKLVAQKIRSANKKFKVLGDIKEALPFGAQVWPKTGKMLVVTEGEIDALSMSQVQGNRYPVVSIGCGAGAQIQKYVGRHRDYFRGFDKVVLMFDQDEPGKEAAKTAAKVIGSKAHIADLPMKDANAMLQAGRVEELVAAMWRAKAYRPEGILDMADLKEKVMQAPVMGLTWPFPKLTEYTYGIRLGEVISLGAGTGIGKSDLYTQVIQHLVTEHKVKVGVFALEQMPVETATRIAGKLAQKTFHIPDSGWTDSDKEAAWSKLMDSGKVFLYDSFGQNDWEPVKDKIEYLRYDHDVRYFFVDHLTALAACQEDERKALETIMAEMGALVKQLDCTLFVISHLSTPEGKSHEEGGRVTIKNFKGSRAVGYWSSYMIGLERDQQAENATNRSTTAVRILKDRYTGRSTGEVFHIGYDQSTGMLYETESPKDAKGAARHGFDEDEGDTDEDSF